MIFATEHTTQDHFAEHFAWYLRHEAQLALEERHNALACACRDTWSDLFPISQTSEGQVDAFNTACAAYRKEAESEHLIATEG